MQGFGNVRETIMRLASGASIEATPREVASNADMWEAAPKGARVYITRLPKETFAATLSAARQLRGRGFVPVPHIAARMVENEAQLGAQLGQLAGEAGVDEVLVVAGSNARPAGVFDNAMQILATGVLQRAGILRIGLAGHPEGHPQVDGRTLQAAIDWKNGYAHSTGAELYLVTQFFFDARPVIAWEREIRACGNALPVRIGLHGVTGASKLLKHALHCGVGASVKALTWNPGGMFRLTSACTPGKMLAELASAMNEDRETRFCGLHFFPLGGFGQTVAWLNALRVGRFACSADEGAEMRPLG